MSGRTRILVTHQSQYLPQCDKIVVLDNGRITHVGSFSQLESEGLDWGVVLKPSQNAPQASVATVPQPGKSTSVSVPSSPRGRQHPSAAEVCSSPVSPSKSTVAMPTVATGGLMTREYRVEGKLLSGTLATYVKVCCVAVIVQLIV